MVMVLLSCPSGYKGDGQLIDTHDYQKALEVYEREIDWQNWVFSNLTVKDAQDHALSMRFNIWDEKKKKYENTELCIRKDIRMESGVCNSEEHSDELDKNDTIW